MTNKVVLWNRFSKRPAGILLNPSEIRFLIQIWMFSDVSTDAKKKETVKGKKKKKQQEEEERTADEEEELQKQKVRVHVKRI